MNGELRLRWTSCSDWFVNELWDMVSSSQRRWFDKAMVEIFLMGRGTSTVWSAHGWLFDAATAMVRVLATSLVGRSVVNTANLHCYQVPYLEGMLFGYQVAWSID